MLLLVPLVNKKSQRLPKALRKLPRKPLMMLLVRPNRLQTSRLKQINLAKKSES